MITWKGDLRIDARAILNITVCNLLFRIPHFRVIVQLELFLWNRYVERERIISKTVAPYSVLSEVHMKEHQLSLILLARL